MNEQLAIPSNDMSFKYFLFRNPKNRIVLQISIPAIIIQFIVFKYFYPYPSFIHGDSFAYLETAISNMDVNTYMVGYSRFLRLFSSFTSSDTALVAFQYLFIHLSILFLLFTIFYFYTIGRITQYILVGFMVFNPLFLHLGNLISSDCIFAGISIFWFSILLWIIHRPSTLFLLLQAIVLYVAFTVRYNAMIYPILATVAFYLSPLSWRKKLFGIGLGLILCGAFAFYTSYKYKTITGYWQYSPFSGWQLANNAMYAYRYVDSGSRKPVQKKFYKLDNMIREFYDSTRNTKKFPSEEAMASTFYMWSPGLPLMKYRDLLFKKDSSANELKKWSSMGPYYKAYGLYIIKQYPLYFLKYFVWPNTRKYYAPPVEFLENYNSGYNYVTAPTKDWFGYKSQIIKTRMPNPKVWILNFYPILSGIINVVMLAVLLFFISLKGWRNYLLFSRGVLMGATVWLSNALFTIFASSVALRFQSFPILLTTIFVVLLIDWLTQLLNETKLENSSSSQLTVKSSLTEVTV